MWEFCPLWNVHICVWVCFPGPCEVIGNYTRIENNLIWVLKRTQKEYRAYLIRLIFYGRLKFGSAIAKTVDAQERNKNKPKKSLKEP